MKHNVFSAVCLLVIVLLCNGCRMYMADSGEHNFTFPESYELENKAARKARYRQNDETLSKRDEYLQNQDIISGKHYETKAFGLWW